MSERVARIVRNLRSTATVARNGHGARRDFAAIMESTADVLEALAGVEDKMQRSVGRLLSGAGIEVVAKRLHDSEAGDGNKEWKEWRDLSGQQQQWFLNEAGDLLRAYFAAEGEAVQGVGK